MVIVVPLLLDNVQMGEIIWEVHVVQHKIVKTNTDLIQLASTDIAALVQQIPDNAQMVALILAQLVLPILTAKTYTVLNPLASMDNAVVLEVLHLVQQ
jgi:hypothetical protein